jgi:hypothetical protein
MARRVRGGHLDVGSEGTACSGCRQPHDRTPCGVRDGLPPAPAHERLQLQKGHAHERSHEPSLYVLRAHTARATRPAPGTLRALPRVVQRAWLLPSGRHHGG